MRNTYITVEDLIEKMAIREEARIKRALSTYANRRVISSAGAREVASE